MFKRKTDEFDKVKDNLIKKQSHEDISQLVQELSNKKQNHKPLKMVAEKGNFLKLGSHKVTGKEFNTTLSQIDDEIIRSKEVDMAIIDHIAILYKAMDALDAEYISGIMTVADVVKAADDKVNTNSQNIEKLITLFKNDPRYVAEKNEVKKTIELMEKKVKISYYIAGASIILTLITLLINICSAF